MADNSATVIKKARILAIVHVIVGILLVWLGIVDHLLEISIGGYICMGIWTGIWMLITGCLGIPGTRNEPSTSRTAFAATFQCFSMISAMLGMGLVSLYSLTIAFQYTDRSYRNYAAEIAILAMILVLGILGCCAGFGVLVVICCCSSPPPQLQATYSVGSGDGMTRRPGSFFVASRMKLSSAPQGGQPQAVYRTTTPGYEPQRIHMPPSYEEGQHVTHQNQQASSGVPVAVRMQAGETFVADQTITPEAQENQPQVVLLSDYRELDDPPPPYEVAVSGYQTF